MTAPRREAPSITVTVTLFADLRRFLPRGADGPQRYTLSAGSRVDDLLAAIGITAGYDVTVGLDGELAGGADVLRDGADVMLLSPMEGGSQGDGDGESGLGGIGASRGTLRPSALRASGILPLPTRPPEPR